VTSDRGSVFVYCPLLKQYPPQPVLACDAWPALQDDILQQVAVHAGAAHGIKEVTPELAEKAQANIREE
jgi:hypothetical protein